MIKYLQDRAKLLQDKISSRGKELSKLKKEVFSLVQVYRDRLKGVQILLTNSQAGPGRTVKQEQEDISCNHVPSF